MIQLLLLVLTVSSAVMATTKEQYCQLCANHTMCLYSGVSQTCREGNFTSGISAEQQTAIVNRHNELRNRVAGGQESQGNPGPQPSASNMKKLVWDNDLATVAQRWADQCHGGHDSCRDEPKYSLPQSKYGYVGQNVFWWPCGSKPDWEDRVSGWYNEVSKFNSSAIDRYRFSTSTGHYTQVVWANTQAVGCGYTKYIQGGSCNQSYVCNYGPGGNMDGQTVYIKGIARASCINNAMDPRYPYLC